MPQSRHDKIICDRTETVHTTMQQERPKLIRRRLQPSGFGSSACRQKQEQPRREIHEKKSASSARTLRPPNSTRGNRENRGSSLPLLPPLAPVQTAQRTLAG